MNEQHTAAPTEGTRGPTRGPAPPLFSRAEGAGRAETAEAPGEPSHTAPIGAYLKGQRALRGVSLEELSATTRIPLRSLERLEGGEFDGEADGFVRGFVRTVAIALGLDADDTVSRMLDEPEPGVWERHSSSRRLKQGVVLAVLFVIALTGFLVAQAGWRLLVGGDADSPERAVVIWHDPVRALAEAAGAAIDPSAEIDPAEGSRVAPSDPGRLSDLLRAPSGEAATEAIDSASNDGP